MYNAPHAPEPWTAYTSALAKAHENSCWTCFSHHSPPRASRCPCSAGILLHLHLLPAALLHQALARLTPATHTFQYLKLRVLCVYLFTGFSITKYCGHSIFFQKLVVAFPFKAIGSKVF